MLNTTRFTALVDVNAPGDPEYIWLPLEIEDFLVQPGLVGVNILKEEYKFSHDMRERVLKEYPDLNPDDICILFIQKGRPYILDVADVEIGYQDCDVQWLK